MVDDALSSSIGEKITDISTHWINADGNEVHLGVWPSEHGIPNVYVADSNDKPTYKAGDQADGSYPYEGLEIGNGWRLVAITADNADKETIANVSKEYEVKGVVTKLDARTLTSTNETIALLVATRSSPGLVETVKISNADNVESIVSLLNKGKNDQIDVVFTANGNLRHVQIGSKGLLGTVGAKPELFTMAADQRGVRIYLPDEEEAGNIFYEVFGIPYEPELHLNKGASINGIVETQNGNGPLSKSLSFEKNITPKD